MVAVISDTSFYMDIYEIILWYYKCYKKKCDI